MEVVDILREGVGVALRIGAPLLILSMLVGILVAIFQAVTPVSYTHLGRSRAHSKAGAGHPQFCQPLRSGTGN